MRVAAGISFIDQIGGNTDGMIVGWVACSISSEGRGLVVGTGVQVAGKVALGCGLGVAGKGVDEGNKTSSGGVGAVGDEQPPKNPHNIQAASHDTIHNGET